MVTATAERKIPIQGYCWVLAISVNYRVGNMTPRVYIVRPAIFAPAILMVVAVAAAVLKSWWFLAALPFIF
jgi:hypothetical protein